MSDATSKVDTGCSSTPKDLNTQNSTKPKKGRKKWDARKRKRETSEQDQKPKGDRRPPNYFFAVKIDEPKIKGAIQAVQDNIVHQNEILRNVVVGHQLAHLTVGLLHLSDKDSVASFTLHIKGLGHFNEKVMFAKVRLDENEKLLGRIAEFLSQEFVEFKSSSPFGYTPHLTLMKLSKIQRNYHLKNKIRRIEKRLFEHVMNIDFGHQNVASLQLLRMARKEKDGYYHCEKAIPFGTVEEDIEKPTEEKYAEYLSSYIVASAACVSTKEPFAKAVYISDIAYATVDSAMNTALREVQTRNNEPSE